MNTRPTAILTGLILLAAAATAQAHDESRYIVRPTNLSGSVTVWSGSHAPSGWAGTLSFGAPVVVGAPVLPVRAMVAPHGHGPHCQHAYHTVVHEYGRPWKAGYAKGPKHHPGRGHGHAHRH